MWMSTLSQKLALKMKAAKKFQFHMMRREGIPDYFARRRSPERVMPPTQLQCSIECVETSQPASQPAQASQSSHTHQEAARARRPPTARPASQPASQHRASQSSHTHQEAARGQAATHGQAGSQQACQQSATKVPGSTWPGQGGQPQRIFIPCNKLLENSQATYYKE